jgi:hypothetical protein
MHMAHRRVVNTSLATPVMLSRWAVLFCVLSMAGCCSVLADTHHVFFLAKRTTDLEPKHFSYIHNEHVTRRLNHAIAKQAWHEVMADMPVRASHHYARGFICGFADYLYRGGTGEPPLVPPRAYWHLGYQSIKGKQAIDEWYQGFRHGSQECQARGLRDLVMVPSSLASSAEASPDDHLVATDEIPVHADAPETLPPPEIRELPSVAKGR